MKRTHKSFKETEAVDTKSWKKRKMKREKTERNTKKYEGVIRDFLNRDDVNAATLYLCCLNKPDQFLKDTNYFVFNWALEHTNLTVLNCLLKVVRGEHHLLMVGYDEYASIKRFIRRSLQMSSSAHKTTAEWREILNRIIEMDPEIITVIENELNRDNTAKDTLPNQRVFKKDLNDLLEDLKSSQSPKRAVTSFFLHQSNLKKSDNPKRTVTFSDNLLI